MIENGTLSSIQPKNAPTSSGAQSWAANVLTASVRCNLGEVTRGERITLGSIITDATQVLRVRDRRLSAGMRIAEGTKVTVQLADDPAVTMQVVKSAHQVLRKGSSMNHWECFLKKVG